MVNDPKKQILGFSWMEPMLPPCALMAGNFQAEGVFTKPLSERFPNYILFNLQKRLMLSFDGVLRELKGSIGDYFFLADSDIDDLSKTMGKIRLKVIKRDPLSNIVALRAVRRNN